MDRDDSSEGPWRYVTSV